MTILRKLNLSTNFSTLKTTSDSQTPTEVKDTSNLSNLVTQIDPTRKITNTFFHISEKSMPTSPDARDLVKAFAQNDTNSVSTRPETGRLIAVNVSLDSSRLGVSLDAGKNLINDIGVLAKKDPKILAGKNKIQEILNEKRGTDTIKVENPTDISNPSPGRITFDDINPSGSGGYSSASFSYTSPGGESYVGIALNPDEKPRVLATYSSDIVDGYATKNAVFCRKFISDRGYATKYIIYRKAIFIENEFRKVAELEPVNLVVASAYEWVVEKLGIPKSLLFTYEDKDFIKDMVYIYKVKVEWTPATKQEVEERKNIEFIQRGVAAAPTLTERLGNLGIIPKINL